MSSLNALDKQGNGERSMIRGRVRWVVHVWFSDEIEKLGPTAWSDDAEEFGVGLEDLKGVYDVLFGVSSTSFSGLILRGRASNASVLTGGIEPKSPGYKIRHWSLAHNLILP